MKLQVFLSFFLLPITITVFAQDQPLINMEKPLPYHEIPETPTTYTAANVAARMIDGLGYRYYWATETLTKENLQYKPSEDSRTMNETLDHLYGLSKTIVNASKNEPNIRSADPPIELTWAEKRKRTLENFKMASDLLKMGDEVNLEEKKIIFQRSDQQSEYPYWNMINGPISDAIWHAGQIVAFRRAAGNPINPKVSVFRGKTRE